jgi:ADP-heptose:LPS heptosyltransferase
MLYRYSMLKKIYQEHFDTVINPTFSRDKSNDDALVIAAQAPHTVGMVANQECVRVYERGYDSTLYTQLFELKERPVFEFTRNRLFTEFITGKPSAVRDTKITPALLPACGHLLPERYMVVFPGSRNRQRIWPTDHFITVSEHGYLTYGYTVVVCGAAEDQEYTAAFCARYRYPYIDLTGTTSLLDMLSILQQAQCLLSVDTGALHLAAAVGCTVYGIFNGSQYKRFAPYPAEIAANFHAVYPDEIEQELADPDIVQQKYEFVVAIPYAAVTAEKVIRVMSSDSRRLVT